MLKIFIKVFLAQERRYYYKGLAYNKKTSHSKVRNYTYYLNYTRDIKDKKHSWPLSNHTQSELPEANSKKNCQPSQPINQAQELRSDHSSHKNINEWRKKKRGNSPSSTESNPDTKP